MKRFFTKLFAPRVKTVRKARRPAVRQARLGLNCLENRLVPATVSLDGSTIVVQGTSYQDDVKVYATSTQVIVKAYSQTGAGDWHLTSAAFAAGSVTAIDFHGYDGDDRFDNSETSLRAVARGYAGNDLLVGGSGHDDLFGYEGNDTLAGNAGDDRLRGFTGDDTYRFATNTWAGSDTVEELIIGGTDTLDFSASPNRLVVDLGALGVNQPVNANLHLSLAGLSEIENVIGGAGNDELTGNWQANQLLGGDGNDVLMGRGGNDVLSGQRGNDFLEGDAGNDTLLGGWDSDTLEGNGGDDVLVGGNGDDTYRYAITSGLSLGSDQLIEHATEWGYDTLDFAASTVGVIVDLGHTGWQTVVYGILGLTLEGDGIEKLVGGLGFDILTGSSRADVILGGAGFDVIHGGGGNDVLYAGTGNNMVYGEDGDDRIFGGEGMDLLEGGAGNDTLSGSFGSDELYGRDGNDVLLGEDGDDTLRGGSGDDALTGGEGDDTVGAYKVGDSSVGEGGNDFLSGGAGRDTLDGGLGSDLIQGGEGDDDLDGGSIPYFTWTGGTREGGDPYVDRLFGGVGNDDFQVHGNSEYPDETDSGPFESLAREYITEHGWIDLVFAILT
jgi:Ca2+-binding RTX toxin-like protein